MRTEEGHAITHLLCCRDINKHIMEENVRLEEEQRAQREYFDKVVDTNVPTPTFFEMFGTSSR